MQSYDRYPPRTSWTAYFWPVILFLVMVGVLAWRFMPLYRTSGLDPNAEPRPIAPRGDLAADEKTTIELFKQSSPAVVHITTLTRRVGRYSFDTFEIPQGTGSGFTWDDKGHVVTNFHVIQ